MKQLFLSILRLTALLVLPLALSLSVTASAVDVFPVCGGNAGTTDVCQSVPNHGTAGDNPIINAIKFIILILSFIIGITSVIMIILAGMWFITSNGDPQAVARARNTVLYALIGIVVVLLAQALVAFVLNKV
jgi:hypothetical protein